MALSSGTRLGPYEIVALLGAGGMGDVYRARDTRLNRDVAIKVLPDLFANDPERLARFTREAQTLAALNHPNIAHIHGLEESGPVRALVMEIVEGDDLSAVLARGPIAVADVLPIARQLADALEAAHGFDIVHRDLKPANIKVRPDGTVKVLDFGLAKALDAPGGSGALDLANSPTFTGQARIHAASNSPATMMGTIIGTAAYMAPEQARGKSVDKRADIWAYGVVLYEMLAGRPAFAGDNVTDILAAVVRAEPDWTALPADTPPSIRRLLVRCLTKDLNARLPDIGVARLEIADASAPPDRPAALTPRRHPLARFAWIGALLLGAAATALAAWLLTPRPAALAPVHLNLRMPASMQWLGVNGPGIAISPDGVWIAYTAHEAGKPGQVFVRALDQDDTRLVPESDGGVMPFFSPDSRQVGFTRHGKIWRVPVTGDTAFEIGAADPTDRGSAWGSDGYIYSGGGSGLSRIAASGGARESLTTVDTAKDEVAHRFPAVVPGQAAIIFSVFKRSLADSRLGVLDLATRKWTVLFDRQAHAPTVMPSGELLFLRGPDLMMAPFDLGRRAVTGTPEPVLSGVMFNNGGAGHYAVSHTGILTYLSEADNLPQTMVSWVSRDGRIERISLPDDTYTDAVVSPDGGRLALLVRERSNRSRLDVWDVARSAFAARLSGDGLRENPSPSFTCARTLT